MDLYLQGASVAIIGGTAGMGRATAECYARDKARVAVLARTRGDLGLPEEIAPMITVLGSRRNTYTTGAVLNVDGGSDFR
jgi:NAD(P)-dependent dehydrogenase (short-subunit alcohol dehydrogenase family)